MKINILTLFPKYFDAFLEQSIIGKAIKLGHLDIEIVNFREYSSDKHKRVDDVVYGGGDGMLLQVQPIHNALKNYQNSHKILLSPQGMTFNQKKAHQLSQFKEITLICGHYEGFDERILNFIDEEISIGDYVLTGGEIPAMAITEAIARLIPGVLRESSHQDESFENQGWLEYPQYTRPANYLGYKVPEVLLSGNHAKIAKWRKEQAYLKTLKNRKDLLVNKGEK